MKKELDELLERLDNPLFSTINDDDLDKLANRYGEDE
jgi:hypothetical protein